jgi:hypothetical protein
MARPGNSAFSEKRPEDTALIEGGFRKAAFLCLDMLFFRCSMEAHGIIREKERFTFPAATYGPGRMK